MPHNLPKSGQPLPTQEVSQSLQPIPSEQSVVVVPDGAARSIPGMNQEARQESNIARELRDLGF